MWNRSFCILVLVVGPLFGCGSDLGECDPMQSTQVVYDVQGRPAYAGQAVIHSTCSNGTCHSALASGENRYGVPAGLNFDMSLAATDEAPHLQQAALLREGRERVRQWREEIFAAIDADTMPPRGNVLRRALHPRPAYGTNLGEDSESRLPSADTIEGLALVRNWLACGAPVIERTTPHPMGQAHVGDVVGPGAPVR